MYRTTFFAIAFTLAMIEVPIAQANINAADASSESQVAHSTSDSNALPAGSDNVALNNVGNESMLELPLPITRAIAQGMALESRFKAESELTGWVLSLDDQFTLVYTTPDHRTLISGALINEAGTNLSELYAQQYFPKPDFSLLEDTTFISIGTPEEQSLPDSASSTGSDASGESNGDETSDKLDTSDQAVDNLDVDGAELSAPAEQQKPHRVVYAFFDPSCPFCHLAWQAFQPYMDKGVEVRWVPVAFLSPESRDKAAAILQDSSPENALAESMRLFNTEEQPQASVKESARRQLQNNMKLMQRFGIQGTPGLVWQDDDGELNIRSGMPKLDDFSHITGLPEQPQTDPKLFRFR